MFDCLMNRCRAHSLKIIKIINCAGVLYTAVIVVSILFGNAYFACPMLYSDEECQLPTMIGYFVFIQLIMNIYCFHRFARNNRIEYWMPARLQLDESLTRYCSLCNQTVPIKCHHCPLCNYCVLRKDHHCFMVGGCVGFGNQRYFIVFVFWATIGAFYGTSFALRYLNLYYKPFLPFGWIDYLPPISFTQWLLTGHQTPIQLLMCLLFSFGAASAIGACGFFASQIFYALQGMTMYEYHTTSIYDKQNNHHQRLSSNQRIVLLFGPYWLLNFIFPQPWFTNRLNAEFTRQLLACSTKDL